MNYADSAVLGIKWATSDFGNIVKRWNRIAGNKDGQSETGAHPHEDWRRGCDQKLSIEIIRKLKKAKRPVALQFSIKMRANRRKVEEVHDGPVGAAGTTHYDEPRSKEAPSSKL